MSDITTTYAVRRAEYDYRRQQIGAQFREQKVRRLRRRDRQVALGADGAGWDGAR